MNFLTQILFQNLDYRVMILVSVGIFSYPLLFIVKLNLEDRRKKVKRVFFPRLINIYFEWANLFKSTAIGCCADVAGSKTLVESQL